MDDDVWGRYAEAVATLGAQFDRVAAGLDDVTRAEGLRHLTRLLHMGMFCVHDYADPAHPYVFLAKTPAMLSGGVTADCIYHEAFVDGRRRYRLRGTRGTAALLEIAAYRGRLGLGDRADLAGAILEDALVVGPDGSVDVVLAPDPAPPGFFGNWIRTDDPEHGPVTWLLIRQYDARVGEVEPARFALEPVDEAPGRAPLTTAEIDAVLGETVAFAGRMIDHFTQKSARMLEWLTNRFLVVDEDNGAGEALPSGHRFAAAAFRLAPDEAWVVTIPGLGRPPYAAAPYWGFQLCNYWFEPLDYGSHWAHRNSATAAVDADGAVRLVVSERRPPAGLDGNWVELRGHTVGSAQFRLSRTDAPMPEITCEVVPVDRLG